MSVFLKKNLISDDTSLYIGSDAVCNLQNNYLLNVSNKSSWVKEHYIISKCSASL